MVGIGDKIEMPGRGQSLPPPSSPSTPMRTGVVEGRDRREESERHQYVSLEEAGLPTFYPPPKVEAMSAVQQTTTLNSQNVLRKADLETPPTPRRGIIIEMNLLPRDVCANEEVKMLITPPESDIFSYDPTARRTGSGVVKYPIQDIEWRKQIAIHETTEWYSTYVRSRKDYCREDLEEVIRLGNQMVVTAGGYRHAARELQEINLRSRKHLVGRIEEMEHVFPAIAPQLLDIARLGVIPEYRGLLPTENRVTHYPYVSADTEKIAKKLRKDVRAGIMAICESEIAEDGCQVISHSSSVVHKKLPGRTLSVDYRVISDLRQINLGNRKEDFYPVEVTKLSETVTRILKLKRQYPTIPVLMTKRDIASAFRRILLHPDMIHIFTNDIPGCALDRNADLFLAI